MAAPIWPISFTGARRSSRDIKEVLKGCRDGQRRQWPIEPIALGVLNQDARFQNRLGEFLDEQGVPVGLGDDLLHHFGGQHAAASHLRDHAFNFVAIEPTERSRCRRWGDQPRAARTPVGR